jgi:hypothetical protein
MTPNIECCPIRRKKREDIAENIQNRKQVVAIPTFLDGNYLV